MRAEEEEEVDGEANLNLQEYPANPDLWRRGANHLKEARNYYGDDDNGEEELLPGRWGELIFN